MDDSLSLIPLPDLFSAIALVAFTFFAFVVSASEMTFFSTESAEENKNPKLNTPEHLLAVARFLNGVFCTAIAILLARLVGNYTSSLVLQILLCIVYILIFAEWLPKMFGASRTDFVAKFTKGFYAAVLKIFTPFFRLSDKPQKHLKQQIIGYACTNLSVGEISKVMESSGDAENDEKSILEGVVRFGSNCVADVMTSRQDIVYVSSSLTFDELMAKILEFGFSRMPVCGESLDDVQGILYVKDLFPYWNRGAQFEWQTLVRKTYFVPETKKIDDLLAEFQKNKSHMAVVVDEFGGTSGVVTLEDVLEEIVGEIRDEYDDDSELNYQRIDENTYVFEAKILLNDFFKITKIDESEFSEVTAEVDSLGGLLIELKGEMPREGEKLSYKSYVFEVLKADKRKIKKVKFSESI